MGVLVVLVLVLMGVASWDLFLYLVGNFSFVVYLKLSKYGWVSSRHFLALFSHWARPLILRGLIRPLRAL